jgi:hypothetical protein
MKYKPTIQAIVDSEIAATEAKVREEYAGLVECLKWIVEDEDVWDEEDEVPFDERDASAIVRNVKRAWWRKAKAALEGKVSQ